MATMGSTQRADAPTEMWIALLGRRDTPTDGVEDYCTFLGSELETRGVVLEKLRVRWSEVGWLRALLQLRTDCTGRSGQWALIQYTAMAWSNRGFPFGALCVLRVLHNRGVRCAVVFHEPCRQGGSRWIDRIRGACQDWVVRRLHRSATKSIFADAPEAIHWLAAKDPKAAYVPIGANIPERSFATSARNGGRKTVAVFCLSDPPNRSREVAEIADALRKVTATGIQARVVFMGRGTAEAKQEIGEVFDSSQVEVLNLGIRSPDEISMTLSQSDAMLCVRGPLYARRGSAIAAIACGLPIVAYGGAAEGTLMEEAGVRLVPYPDRSALGVELARVLSNSEVWQELHERNVLAHQKYFSWSVIASGMLRALGAAEKFAP